MQKLDYNNKSKYHNESAYIRAQKRLKEIKGFYWHAFWYVVVNVFIVVMIISNSDGNIWHFGTFSTPLFWGIGLAFHATMLFGRNLFFSKSWENKKIQEFMEKDAEARSKNRL
ncbi:MAG: 2TM domain-containing protein [Algibacter sp.]